ncbi:hypothetical protein J2Y55_001122 [Bosea sp. BE125]|uniref:hypothetical protein n=1 Tax=Bosea sp. BE125 TaxID=2817909 RepID=UPI002866E4F5|nr:hypothetical protein [Bosea sp. BE125]MDR6870122.1 hypothetical protein [Bosea sp. BE125]
MREQPDLRQCLQTVRDRLLKAAAGEDPAWNALMAIEIVCGATLGETGWRDPHSELIREIAIAAEAASPILAEVLASRLEPKKVHLGMQALAILVVDPDPHLQADWQAYLRITFFTLGIIFNEREIDGRGDRIASKLNVTLATRQPPSLVLQ